MIQMLQRLSSLILVATAATPAVAQYRGMPAGWPTTTYAPATTAGYAPAAGGQGSQPWVIERGIATRRIERGPLRLDAARAGHGMADQ